MHLLLCLRFLEVLFLTISLLLVQLQLQLQVWGCRWSLLASASGLGVSWSHYFSFSLRFRVMVITSASGSASGLVSLVLLSVRHRQRCPWSYYSWKFLVVSLVPLPGSASGNSFKSGWAEPVVRLIINFSDKLGLNFN